ncbi:hypothetical protein [Desulfoscipio gibsoniae]|uniref:Uncharacterized protein n=1 Tax=Desulfoscipio gibsoniae DSM 7213 TaxID=767817 RepID=R4KH21_9FIRM|nr:hypothetical protein [Desulfoscipio gibsoniae]AGL02488.1 hypothetical protein Desgi_3128 [Desulfoscipio gibsoniae DSM 7213]
MLLQRLIIVIMGSLWLLWVLFTRYRSDWTALEWGAIGLVSISVLSSGYELIKEKGIKKREE